MEKFRNVARLIRNLRTAYKPKLPLQAMKPDYHLIPITDADGVMVAQVRMEHVDFTKDLQQTRRLIEGAKQRACLFAAAPDLLGQTELFVKTLKYLIKVDESKGDQEGANMKRVTLEIANETIKKAKGE